MAESKQRKSIRRIWKRIFENCASVRLTVILLAILIPASILGTLIPQERPFQEYFERYGLTWFRIVHFLWLDSIFKSFWFVGLVLVLGVNVAACTIQSIFKRKGYWWGFVIVHSSLIFLMIGGLVSLTNGIRGQVTLHEGEAVESFQTREGKIVPLGFQLRLKKFKLVTYEDDSEKLIVHVPNQNNKSYEFRFRLGVWTQIPGTEYRFRVTHYVPDFRLDRAGQAVSVTDKPNNPAVYVEISGRGAGYGEWVFDRYPNFHHQSEENLKLEYHWAPVIPKDFISYIEVVENGKIIKEKAIEVNRPLRHRGFSVYQSTYDAREEKWSGLEIVRDPGVWLVFSGIIGLMLGLIHNIYVRPLLLKRADV